MITFEQFAKLNCITLQHVRRLAMEGCYKSITHNGKTYELSPAGNYPNGKPRWMIKMQLEGKKKHLSPEQREAALTMLNAGETIQDVADAFGVSYVSIYRLSKLRRIERKKRSDAGQHRIIIPAQARQMFESIYIQNAQGPNVKLAWSLTCRAFPEWRLPLSRFRAIAAEIEPERLRFHRESEFELRYTPRIRRDLWSEFEYMQRVSLDGWTVPDRVLRSWGMEHMSEKKFQFGGKDTSMVVICAIEQKTGEVIAFRAFERSVTKEDVLSLLLDVIHRRGRPAEWLLDNGTEFVNESVQRFLRGLYTTEEHQRYEENKKTRIIFSEPYGPFGKARHERLHRIFKDEFCAFSRSYSPNPEESRKPTKQLSYVKPVQTLAEWSERFDRYLNGFFRERQRTMWMHPLYSRNHEINKERPRTMAEAVDRAYTGYEPVRIDPMRLAFLYASKFTARIKRGLLHAPAHIGMGRKLRYLCTSIPHNRYGEMFEVVVNPLNIAQAWVCDLNNNVIGEAWDIQARDAGVINREQAAIYRKQRNRLNKLARESAHIKAQLINMDELLGGARTQEQCDSVNEVFTEVAERTKDIEQQSTLEVEPDFFFEDSQTILMEGNNE